MMYNNEMPSLIKADLNLDGLDEIYIGGGKDQPGTLITFNNNHVSKSNPLN